MARRKTTVYLDDDLRMAIKAVAVTSDCSENDVIEDALRNYLESGRAAKAREDLRHLMEQWTAQPTGLTEDEAMELANEAKQWARQQKRASTVLRGVADVNVYVSAAIIPAGPSDRLVSVALDGKWQPVVSPHLLEELRTVFGYERIRRRRPIAETHRFVANLATIAEVVADAPEPWPAVTADPKDDYLTALARAAEADAIISGDHHLTDLVDLVPPVLRPSNFLAMVQRVGAVEFDRRQSQGNPGRSVRGAGARPSGEVCSTAWAR